ncbi:MAG TPA: pyridoxal phosphate-dependent aminotransferase [Vicinamibacteria bacterium]|nr:pyridoxal phosphate-dependent aminotransferase [Vicinamibacteria bacterium]
MLSSRTRWERAPNRLSLALDARRRRGEEVVDLTVSNPTEVGLQAPAEVLSLLGDAGGAAYAPDPRGLLPAREAVAADFARRGHSVAPDRLVLCSSTSEAYAWLFKLLADPGDNVLVPRPSYPLFEFLADLESISVRHYPLVYDGAWHVDLAAVEEAIRPRTRAIVLVNPNNPTGSFVSRTEAGRLLGLCARRGLSLVSDEVFADFGFAPDPSRVTSFADDGAALAFSLGGLSKSCGLPQLKLGWIAVSGPAEQRAEALARLEIVADTYLSVATPVQRALPGILARLPDLQAPIAARVRRNRGALDERLSGSPATLLASDGGWTAVVQVPATLTEEERVLRLLERDGVLVHPGFFFDFAREAYLVLSLLPRPADFDRGAARVLADVL